MEKLSIVEGVVAPLDRANVDTDAIIPKQFLKSIHRSGFGPNLFDEWRYLDHGEPGMDNANRPINTDFVLNQSRYQGASILSYSAITSLSWSVIAISSSPSSRHSLLAGSTSKSISSPPGSII